MTCIHRVRSFLYDNWIHLIGMCGVVALYFLSGYRPNKKKPNPGKDSDSEEMVEVTSSKHHQIEVLDWENDFEVVTKAEAED